MEETSCTSNNDSSMLRGNSNTKFITNILEDKVRDISHYNSFIYSGYCSIFTVYWLLTTKKMIFFTLLH